MKKKYLIGLLTLSTFTACNEIDFEMPEHKLDVEFRYELICSDVLLKYVTPEVTITDGTGKQQTLSIEDGMWKGAEHKTWTHSIHYDSLNVSNALTVRYIPKREARLQDEPEFDNVHNLSCLIMVQEDGNGRRNNYTIIPDFPSKTSVKKDVLETFIEGLSNSSSTRGGHVNKNGEITKKEIN